MVENNLMKKNRIVVTCAKGIVPFLREEIDALTLPIVDEGSAHVETEGTAEDAMKLNLFIRTGQRVLFLLQEFRAKHPDELYRNISEFPWEEHLAAEGYVCVTSSVETRAIRDSRYANLKCKDAIVDRIKKACGQRPDSGPKRDGAVVHLHWQNGHCQSYLDTSGEPLSRRGYRRIPLKAPMQETLAAAVVLATGWKGAENFVNPMCGSGTLAIEACLMALNKPPGILRENYGFMHWKGFDDSLWKKLRHQGKLAGKKDLAGKVMATDIRPEAVEAARKNAATAGVSHLMEFGVCDYSETPVPSGGGVVVLNPEYGERMGEVEDLKETYRGIGNFFKGKCRGYSGFIFTGNFELAKHVGLRTKRRIPFFNSNIECRLLEYDLYEGSRKKKTL
jgi:23S rRNA G2445 N2-methylase RlmL